MCLDQIHNPGSAVGEARARSPIASISSQALYYEVTAIPNELCIVG